MEAGPRSGNESAGGDDGGADDPVEGCGAPSREDVRVDAVSVASARAAFDDGRWARQSPAARKAVLQNRKSQPAGFAQVLMTKQPARGFLAKKMREETAKKARELTRRKSALENSALCWLVMSATRNSDGMTGQRS